MYTVSNAFKTAMESNIKSLAVNFSFYNDNEDKVTISGNNALVSITISCDGELGSSAMRKAEISLLKANLPATFSNLGLEDSIFINYSTMTNPTTETWETVYIGEFIVKEIKYSDDDETCSLVAYDSIINTMVTYADNAPPPDFWTADTTLAQYVAKVLDNCGITLGNTDFVLNDMKITSDRFGSWEDNAFTLNDYAYSVRDLINDVCKISGTVAIMSPYASEQDRLYFKKINMLTSVYNIELGKLISHKFQSRYGDINRVIYAREPQGDYGNPKEYSDSIATYGATEWKVDNNQLVDYQPPFDPNQPAPADYRDQNINSTFVAVCGVSATGHAGAIYYYPFEAETVGYGWFEIGDRIKIDDKYTLVLSYSVTFDGGIEERISAPKTNKTDTKVQYISNKAQNQTQLVVDKQNQIIKSYVDKTEGNTKSIAILEQTMRGFNLSLSKTGGYNLLLNSVMYNYKKVGAEYQPTIWETSGQGVLTISPTSSPDSDSKNQFTLNNKTVTQKVELTPDNDSIATASKIYYSLSFKLKKSLGTTQVRIRYGTGSNVQYFTVPNIPTDPIENYTKFKLEGILPKEIVNYVEIFGGSNSESSLTDVYLEKNDKASDWTQANGEMMNSNVIIDNSGIIVRGNDGEYSSVMTPIEFSGKYSGDTVFTLNGDTTVVNSIQVANDFILPPLRIHPDSDGWAVIRI